MGTAVRPSRRKNTKGLILQQPAPLALQGGPLSPNPGVAAVALRQGDAPSGVVLLPYPPDHPRLPAVHEAQEQGRQLPPAGGGEGEPWAYKVRPSRLPAGATATVPHATLGTPPGYLQKMVYLQ